jgi:type I restriction enzyme S subunit
MDLVKVNSKIDSITYGLLYSIFADSRFKSHALGYVNGTTVLHLSKKSVPEYKIALPSELTKLNKYGLILNSLFEKESFIIDESRRLAELRDTPVDMFTTVFIGNSQTMELNGRMVTPRGYRSEKG